FGEENGRQGTAGERKATAEEGDMKYDSSGSPDEEEFFDALNELDYQAQRDSWDGTLTYLVPSRSVREDSNQPPHDGGRGRSGSSRRSHGGKYAPNIKRNGGDVENGGFASPAVADTDDGDNDGSSGNRTSKFSIFSWLRSYWGREASWYNGDDDDDDNSHSSRSGTSAQQQRRQHGQRWSAGETTTAVSRGKADGSRGKCRAANPAPYMSAALGWCCKPALRALGRRSIDTLARWLCIANAVSSLLAVGCIVAG
ncbi:unnamed protein product, partial [Sphacelaria rigidula]